MIERDPPAPAPVETDPFDGTADDVPLVLPSSHISAQIRCQCTRGLKPARPWSKAKRVQIAVALCVGLALLVGLLLSHHAAPSTAKWVGAVAWFGVIAGTLTFGVGDYRPHTRALRWSWVLLAPLTFCVYLESGCESQLTLQELLSDATARSSALKCGLFAFGAGVSAFVGLLYLWRRTDPFTPHLTGGLIGLISGIAGAVAIGLMCPNNDSWHALLSHGLVILALLGAGILAGRRVVCP